MSSPTQRTLKHLRDEGWTVGIVERWVQRAFKRIDLFGFIDLVAIRKGHSGVVGVQTTSGSGHAAHRDKILAEPNAKLWLETGNSIWLLTWSKRGPRGKRKLWTARLENMVLEDFL